MVLPSPAAPDAVPSRRWLDRLTAVLHLGREQGVMVLVRGGWERLGDLVRGVIAVAPDADVLVRADALASLPPNSTVVLCLREADFEWLNMARPVVRGHRVVLFGDAEIALKLEQQAFDFFDWISHRIDAPKGPPPFAVRRLRAAACARAPWIVWRGGDLDAAFAEALPGRELARASASLAYGDLVEALRPRRRGWIGVTEVTGPIRLQRARWAAAEGGRLGQALFVEPNVDVAGAEEIHGVPASLADAAEALSSVGLHRGARLAALLDLDPEAIAKLAENPKAGATEERAIAFARRTTRARATTSELSGRRLPAWSKRVQTAIAQGDNVVALRWAKAWRATTTGATAAAAGLQLATIETRQGNYAEARALLRELIPTFEQMGDRRRRAASLHQLAIIEESQGNYAEARALLRESIQVKEEIGDRHGRAASLHQLAIIESRQGNYAEARALLRESIQVEEEIGDRQGRAASLHQLAIIEESQGNYAKREPSCASRFRCSRRSGTGRAERLRCTNWRSSSRVRATTRKREPSCTSRFR